MSNRTAVFDTSKGTFRIELYEDKVPVTTGNYVKLINQGFYNGLVFHRVIPGFMIQGGCPKGNGTGGPGYSIKDEFHKDLSNVRGTIAMANCGPNTGGSQWFINLVDNTFLDSDKPSKSSQHPVFGKVASGMEVVDAIGTVKTDRNDKPLQPVTITKITIQ